MKRLITTMIFVVIMSSALGTYVIPRTITVDAMTLNALRSSLLPASPAYDPYIADLSDSDEMVIPESTGILPRGQLQIRYMIQLVDQQECFYWR